MPETSTLSPDALVIRTATSRLQCHCARPLLGYRAELFRGTRLVAVSPQPLPSRPHAEAWTPAGADHEHFTGVRVVPEPNLDYQPECLGTILPGDRYIADLRTDEPYCLRCGTARAATVITRCSVMTSTFIAEPTAASWAGPRTDHAPVEIYEPCSCHPEDPGYLDTHFPVDGVGMTCARGLVHVVCRDCCTGVFEQHCEAVHDHRTGTPWCPRPTREV